MTTLPRETAVDVIKQEGNYSLVRYRGDYGEVVGYVATGFLGDKEEFVRELRPAIPPPEHQPIVRDFRVSLSPDETADLIVKGLAVGQPLRIFELVDDHRVTSSAGTFITLVFVRSTDDSNWSNLFVSIYDAAGTTAVHATSGGYDVWRFRGTERGAGAVFMDRLEKALEGHLLK